jgi:hypothetical protein
VQISFPEVKGVDCGFKRLWDFSFSDSIDYGLPHQLQNIVMTDIHDTDRGYSHTIRISTSRSDVGEGSVWTFTARPEPGATAWLWLHNGGKGISGTETDEGSSITVRYPAIDTDYSVRLAVDYDDTRQRRHDTLTTFLATDALGHEMPGIRPERIGASQGSSFELPLSIELPGSYRDPVHPSKDMLVYGYDVHLSYDTTLLKLPLGEIAKRIHLRDTLALSKSNLDSSGLFLHVARIVPASTDDRIPLGTLTFDCTGETGTTIPVRIDYVQMTYFNNYDTSDHVIEVLFPAKKDSNTYAEILVGDAGAYGPTPLRGEISIFPNPTRGRCNINLPRAVNGFSYSVLDVLGNTVKNGNSPGTKLTIDLTDLDPGSYWIRCNSSEGILTRKLAVSSEQ